MGKRMIDCLMIFVFVALLFWNAGANSAWNRSVQEGQWMQEVNKTAVLDAADDREAGALDVAEETEFSVTEQIREQLADGFRLIPGTSDGTWRMLEPEEE